MSPQSSRLGNVLLAASLISTSAAQNTTNTTGPAECNPSGRTPSYEQPVNGTGTWNVSVGNAIDLYVSLTFGESRNNPRNSTDNRVFDPWTYAYISAPENTTTQACLFMFDALDNHRQGDGQNGCDGVISQKCQDLLEKKYQFPVNILDLIDSSSKGFRCPSLTLDKDEVDEACGEGFFGGISTTLTANLTNTTCNAAPPGIDVPAGFSTRGLFGTGPTEAPWEYDTDVDNFTWYDEYITRPVPVLVAAASDDAPGGVTKVVCIAPDHVREGSRVPPESVNNENAAAGMEWGRKAGMATLVAGVVVMSFVIA
ncbi:hypothetical protein AA0118_g9252 [Alternaria tenuissima]|nr:hypothetical protein AALT_g10305 [Alternaria alternata]RYN54320.1 hypothetical protein AA0118_g9252 [Alternaria tenuissima]